MRTLLHARSAALPAIALAQPESQPGAHFQPQAFLAGSCWKGTFPDGKQSTSTASNGSTAGGSCATGTRSPAVPRLTAEKRSITSDTPSKSVHYLYINMLGGNSRGTVMVKDGVLVFPEETYSDGKQQQTYRSSWRRDGDDAYFVLTEVRSP